MSITPIINYWRTSAKNDLKVAQGLLKLRQYSHCLFFCHLTLEKMLKAVYVQRQRKHAPYIHDLVILGRKAGLSFSAGQRDSLETITSFNIQGRYAEYKSDFYKRFHKRAAAQKYFAITQSLMVWLEKELIQR